MKKEKNRCFTYFRIAGTFDPCKVSAILEIEPYEFWRIGDVRKNGSIYDFAAWTVSPQSSVDFDHNLIVNVFRMFTRAY